MRPADRTHIYAPDHVTVPTGLLADVLALACTSIDRTDDDQAALIVAARLLEACGIAGHVERVESTHANTPQVMEYVADALDAHDALTISGYSTLCRSVEALMHHYECTTGDALLAYPDPEVRSAASALLHRLGRNGVTAEGGDVA